jgi:hypothetical protein
MTTVMKRKETGAANELLGRVLDAPAVRGNGSLSRTVHAQVSTRRAINPFPVPNSTVIWTDASVGSTSFTCRGLVYFSDGYPEVVVTATASDRHMT